MMKSVLPPSSSGYSPAPDTQWDEQIPFKRFNSIMKVFSALPTLPLHEWMVRYLLLICTRHALETGKLELLGSAVASALTTSTLSRIVAKKGNVRYPAQATVMVAPRQSLHEHEFLVCALYAAALAARRHGGVARGALGEAALAGVLTHLFCAPADANGPRFLWWTWHETHPSVRTRVLNFPVSQALAEMSTGFAFSLIAGWVIESFRRTAVRTEDSLGAVLKEVIHWLPEQNRPLAEFITSSLDSVREALFKNHPLSRLGFVALCTPVLHTILSGLFQMIALDRVGSPSIRSYKLMLAALTLWASTAPMRTLPVTISDSKSGARLAATVVAYFAMQTIIPLVGDPAKHVSTGAHQPFGRQGVIRRDAFGNRYEQNVTESDVDHFSIEGSTRSSMLQELEDKREALDDLANFIRAADKRVGDTELALQETLDWAKQAQKHVPHLEESEFLREMEATNSVRVARIRTHLEAKLERIKNERGKVATFETKLRAKIARLEDLLEVGSLDPAGHAVIPASPVGPASVWYTIRGVRPNRSAVEEAVGVGLVGLLGMTAFTKALAYAA